ncbi:hypothetical protein D8M04_03650 [Oceanobacillus piezotolerans]|uniref:DUF1440 domain-containing protein n=1 Tax=Oceanobacillus piezotolerans TaxID=2448030 RepID=A0A498DGQ4_9BACI|nr:hypothetical protein [Oceanobacillus piezotolerans]RLL48368.1 hypothetical protein D8M04_03650 [Oceanobacillus piezotolerans]
MKRVMKLTVIGIIAGIILSGSLKIIQLLTHNDAYILLFNTDYIPLINQLHNWSIVGIIFHFVTCISSVIGLFYILRALGIEYSLLAYILVYTVGSAMLFPLTALSEKTPSLTDFPAFIYWTAGHMVYSFAVGLLVKRWVR